MVFYLRLQNQIVAKGETQWKNIMILDIQWNKEIIIRTPLEILIFMRN